MSEKILDIKEERLSFFTPAGEVKALNGVSFTMNQGDVLGVVGESGSGKSVTAYSVMGLTAYPGKLVGGKVWFNGHEIENMKEKDFRKIRGNEVSIIFQDPMTSLNPLGPNMISIFIIFALLYWVGMARIVRSQILILKESEYVTAARALGASSGRIIKKHLLTNCIGTLIVTTTLQIPASIFTESYLSFIGLGVAAPLPSLGSLATDAVKGMNTYPHLLIAPALMISVMILVFNLFGDGLRDAFDPKLKN